jgi:hypothetical protein
MADGTTTNYGLTKPEVGLSNDTWGTKLNANMDAIDAAIKAVSDAALKLSSFSANNSVLAKNSAGALATIVFATGTVLGRRTGEIVPITNADLKSDLALNNVENKSSATIRGELTSGNVTTALGFTPSANNHNHDATYAPLVHNHDATYAPRDLTVLANKTASYSLAAGDRNSSIPHTGTGQTITVPSGLPDGFTTVLRVLPGSGSWSLTGSGITLLKNGATGNANGTLSAGAVVTLVHHSGNIVTASGPGLA